MSTRITIGIAAAAVMAGILAAACTGGGGGPAPTTPPSPITSQPPITSQTPCDPTRGPEFRSTIHCANLVQPLIDMSRADLAQRLGIPVDEIQGGGGFPVEWPDTSLGHPQPGQVYAQVITQGYEITLEAGGKTYTYHTSMDAVVLVE